MIFVQKQEWMNHRKNEKISKTHKKEFLRVDGLRVENWITKTL